jgi:hypothetical protein
MRNAKVFFAHNGMKGLFAGGSVQLDSYGIDEIYPLRRRFIK